MSNQILSGHQMVYFLLKQSSEALTLLLMQGTRSQLSSADVIKYFQMFCLIAFRNVLSDVLHFSFSYELHL